MPRKASRWKRAEREIATTLGTVRQLHRDGRAGSDVTIDGWDIQIKTRMSLPAWFLNAWNQAVRDTQSVNQPAVVFVLAPGRGIKVKRFVVLDFDQWVNTLNMEETIDALLPVDETGVSIASENSALDSRAIGVLTRITE